MLFRKLANEVCRPLLFRAMSLPNTSKVKQMKSDGKSNIVWVDLEVNFLCKSVMSMCSLIYFHFHFAQYILKAANPSSLKWYSVKIHLHYFIITIKITIFEIDQPDIFLYSYIVSNYNKLNMCFVFARTIK